MQKSFLLLLFLFPVLSYSQININKSRSSIKKETLKFQKQNPLFTITLSETDSTILISEATPEKTFKENLLHLNKTGICKSETINFNCDSCYKNELERILLIEKYSWKKINENQYISKFEENLLLELPTEDKSKKISIIWMDWNKILYDLLLSTK